MPLKKYGTRLEVWNGLAMQTKGGLTKSSLFFDAKDGKIKSVRKSVAAKAANARGRGPSIPGNIQIARGVLPAGGGPAIPGNIQFASGVLPAGGGVLPAGGGMAGAGLQGAAARDFIRKVVRAAQKAAPSVAKFLTGPLAKELADRTVDALRSSGDPRAVTAAATITALRPYVRSALETMQRGGRFAPMVGGGTLLPGQ